MRTTTKEITLDITGQEARDIAYHIKHSLTRTIGEHWNHLQQQQDGERLFYERSDRDIEIMKQLYFCAGDEWSYKNAMDEFARLFEERRKEREQLKDNKTV